MMGRGLGSMLRLLVEFFALKNCGR